MERKRKTTDLILTAEMMKIGTTRILNFEDGEDIMKHCTIYKKRSNLYELIITNHYGRTTVDVGKFDFTLEQLKELKFWLEGQNNEKKGQ